jgi:hypothetical protein
MRHQGALCVAQQQDNRQSPSATGSGPARPKQQGQRRREIVEDKAILAMAQIALRLKKA